MILKTFCKGFHLYASNYIGRNYGLSVQALNDDCRFFLSCYFLACTDSWLDILLMCFWYGPSRVMINMCYI